MVYDRWLSKKEVLEEFENAKDDDKFCVYCYEKLEKTKEGTYFCPNEMCLNEEQGEIE